ncbi:MAG: SRPBCC family protein [Nocardioidaceae bacterium]
MSSARTLGAAPETVWHVASDPWRLPAWWPGVERVEQVDAGAWTAVLSSPKGRTIRADFTRLAAEPARLLAWRQELAGSPFDRVLSESVTALLLEPGDGGGTHVELKLRNRTRGLARLGSLQMGAAMRRQLDAALDGLEALV